MTEAADQGTDTVRTTISYTLGVNVENLVLTGTERLDGTGNELANAITGNDGDNRLDGGAGADTLIGGEGSDIYIVDDGGDVVQEAADDGTDTVRASVSFTLGAHVEHLQLTGTGNLDGTGSEGANTLTGNSGSNVLQGGKGDDTLDGGAGQDKALFSGAISDYTVIRNQDGSVTIVDKRADEDGTDLLRNIELVQFSNGTLSLENQAPAAPAGSFVVNEGKAAGTVVANLAEKDADGETVTYTFEGGGTVSADSRFKIVGNQILVNQPFGVDEDDTVTYAVRASDGKLTTDGGVTITVRNVATGGNAPPDEPSGSFSIDERSPEGASVATLTRTDDEGETVTYTFADALAGSNGLISADERFKIVLGNQIQVNQNIEVTADEPVDYELIASDGEATANGTVRITVNNVNRAPDIAAVEASENGTGGTGDHAGKVVVAENAGAGVIASTTASDPDGQALTYSLGGTNGTYDGLFSINEDTGAISVANAERLAVDQDTDYTLTVVASDGSASDTQTVTVRVTNVNQTPVNNALSAPVLTGTVAAEYAAAGSLVGTLSAVDEAPGALTYQLLDNAGGRFTLANGNQILVENGFKLDFEQAASHKIKVRVSDGTHIVDQDLVINVTDVNPEVTAGSADHDVFFGGALDDRLSGGGGHDTIGGGAGKDKLYGGKGKTSKDAFVFDTKLTSKSVANRNKDKIYDFGSKYDSLFFDDAAFTNKTIAKYLKKKNASLDKPAKLKASYFKKGSKATDKDDFFILKGKKLYWDVDGSGRKAMVEIASFKLQKKEGETLTHKDFFFI
ncbi:cadherin domain-containing protein [Microvirga sp. SM9]|nr:cadherin domain-containing protein [Microvirga lenta]